MKGLKGKVALVTGGSSGIGKATVGAFAREGTKVVLCDIHQKESERVVEEINKTDGEALFIKTDVSKEDDVEFALNKTVEVFGRLDFGINNAGISGELSCIDKCTIDTWDKVISINLTGVWICMKYEIIQMLKTGGGNIVNTSSIGGVTGTSYGVAPYHASKHGVIGLTKSAALEYALKGIRVNAVCPGVVKTTMITSQSPEIRKALLTLEPIGRFADPDEIANCILWLCSDESSFVTGHSLVVDGGYTAQ